MTKQKNKSAANDSPVRTLKISISGIRGVVGDTLTPSLLVRFAESFGTYINSGAIVIGRDTRPSGEMVKFAVTAGLTAAGCQVLDLGVCPVPTIQFMVRRLKADGGIAITASHNPAQWNALKFIRNDGCFLNAHQARELIDIYHQGDYIKAPADKIKNPRAIENAVKYHTEAIIKKIGKLPGGKKPLAVVDCVNGAGAVMSVDFLNALGCDVIGLYTKPDGHFPRPPEPLPENLGKLCDAVRRTGADIGFAQDADADRLAVVDEKGRPIGEDYTLALAADYILRREKGTVVVNLATSHAVDDIAAAHGCPIVKTRIGEINVVERMKTEHAVIGGEGNGGVIYPAVNYTRDSFAAMALILHHLKNSRKKVSALAAALPQYRIVKTSLPCPTHKAFALLDYLREKFSEENPDCTEGIKIQRGNAWTLIRPSNTEPIVRIMSEAKTAPAARRLNEEFEKIVRYFINT
ncbi:MAG: phosphoglucosamine mutase [bacterium]